MNQDFEKYESSIKKTHSFGWTPKHKEEFRTQLSKLAFIPIVIQTFEKLGWDIVYRDETTVEAKRKDNWNRWTEKIAVNYDFGKVTVKSTSLGNEMWDLGRNSKRVKLFIYAFKETEKEFDAQALVELEEKVEKANNWDDYEVPETLPQPSTPKKPQFIIPIVGTIIASLLLGLLLAFISVKGIYIIFLFEICIGLAIGFVLKWLIKNSNYTIYKNLHYLLIISILIIYLSNQYFQYLIILNENNYEPIGFLEFIKLRLEAGLTIKKLNTGWIGLVISWILQLVITYYIGVLQLLSGLASYQLNRVPTEVIDFAFYHFVKGKSESEVRGELSKKGWSNKQNQDEVFEAIGSISASSEINRME